MQVEAFGVCSTCGFGLGPSDTDGDRIGAIRALQYHLIAVSPRVPPTELHDIQVRKDVVVKETAESTRIPAGHLEGFTDPVPCAAGAFDRNHLCTQGFNPWRGLCHGRCPFFLE